MENKKIFHQIASILTELIPIRLEALKQCRNTTDENWNEIENELSNAVDALRKAFDLLFFVIGEERK